MTSIQVNEITTDSHIKTSWTITRADNEPYTTELPIYKLTSLFSQRDSSTGNHSLLCTGRGVSTPVVTQSPTANVCTPVVLVAKSLHPDTRGSPPLCEGLLHIVQKSTRRNTIVKMTVKSSSYQIHHTALQMLYIYTACIYKKKKQPYAIGSIQKNTEPFRPQNSKRSLLE